MLLSSACFGSRKLSLQAVAQARPAQCEKGLMAPTLLECIKAESPQRRSSRGGPSRTTYESHTVITSSTCRLRNKPSLLRAAANDREGGEREAHERSVSRERRAG